jgi:hypothetical protein
MHDYNRVILSCFILHNMFEISNQSMDPETAAIAQQVAADIAAERVAREGADAEPGGGEANASDPRSSAARTKGVVRRLSLAAELGLNCDEY